MNAARQDAPTPAHGFRSRLRQDFDLAIMTSFGLIAMAVIIGFAVYRFASGNVIGGTTNLGMVAAVAIVLAYVARGGRTDRAAVAFTLIIGASCVASSLVFGRTGAYWGFLVLWINFVLTDRRIALAIGVAVIVAYALQPSMFASGVEYLVYLVTALMVILYGWLFSTRFNAQRRRLEDLASHDELTGAGNRRLLHRDVAGAIARRRRDRTAATLAVLDLDHFKAVNDRYGHEHGDRVLVRLVEIVRGHLRRGDGLYRLGGEEFVVLLPGTDGEAALALLAALHRRLGQELLVESIPVTVSIGAAMQLDDEDASSWLARADAALYRAKHQGRNRIEVSAAGDACPFTAAQAAHATPAP